MKFDEEYFDAGLYRMGTRSEKWDAVRLEVGKDALPFWVADMDFPCPPAAQEAILYRASHPTYGYTAIMEDDYKAVTDFWQRRHGLNVEPDELLMLPCVVTGMKVTIQALTKPEDGVIIQSPVYGPFRFSVEATGRKLFDCPLKRNEDGRYEMDLNVIEDALKQGARLMLLCNPHNPVSRCWTREELRALVELLDRYDAYLVSDEIHADFVYKPGNLIPALTVSRHHVVSLCAASKTFNLAGLQQATCICPEKETRDTIQRYIQSCGVTCGNIFALEATRTAYEQGDEWLDGLLRYLDGNRHELKKLLSEYIPEAVMSPIEATYLAWIDLRSFGFSSAELKARTEKAGVIFTDGDFFGQGGDGFERFNFACPRRYLIEGVARLQKALM